MNEALSSQFFHFPWKMVASDCLQHTEVAAAASLRMNRRTDERRANEDDVFFYPSVSSSDSKAGS